MAKKAEPKATKQTRTKEKKPTDKLADKTLMTRILQGIFGDAQKKTLVRYAKKAAEINKLEPKYEAMSDDELASQTEVLRQKFEKLTKAEQQKLFQLKFKLKPLKNPPKNLLWTKNLAIKLWTICLPMLLQSHVKLLVVN